MANESYSNQLEALFSEIDSSSTAGERQDGALWEEVIACLLESEAEVEPLAAERSTIGPLLSPTGTGGSKNGSPLEGAIAELFEGGAGADFGPELMIAPTETEEAQPRLRLPRARALSAKITPGEQQTRISRLVLPVLAITLAVLTASLLIRLIWPTAMAWAGFHTLYLATCALAVAVMGIQWRFNSSMSGVLKVAEEKQAESTRTQAYLEERVASLFEANALFQKWTLQFQVAAQVLQGATSEMNLDALLQQAVKLTRDRFDLYYVGLFLIDESRQWAVLRAGTGEAGCQMVAQGYRVAVGGASPLGQCTANAQAHIAFSAAKQALLPESRSQIVLPLQYADQVIGAMDWQSTQHRAFSEEDVSVLQTMADQLAVAIANAQAYTKTQARLDEAERIQRSTNSRHQSKYRLAQAATHYERRQLDAIPFSEQVLPETQRVMAHQEVIVRSNTDGGKEQAALIAPIMLRDEAIGALGFHENNGHKWTDDEIALLADVADQVALAVENVRLFEQTQTALTETEALYRASHRITTCTGLDALYQILVDEMADRLGAQQCQLTIFDSENGYAKLVAEYRPTPDQEAAPTPITDNPTYELLLDTHRPLVIEDASAHPAPDKPKDAPAQANVKTMLLVPMVVREELIGSLAIETVGQKRVFTEAELDFCQTLSRQAAITIDNIRAFEEQKETAERLREVDRFKTQFLANMSHELRTPLNSIIGFSRVILKGIDGPLTELQQTDLTAIYNSGQHLLGLINDILDLSKIGAGKMELNFDEMDLKPIIKGVMSTAVGLVKDRPIKLEQHVPEDLPIIWADSTRVRQILLNLVSNATKFTERGKISLTADYDDECVSLSITDTGIGIPQEKLERIFEEFTQADGTTTRRFGGTGLGLPISRHFAEMHGGEINVQSEVGVGSTFTVTLPIRAQTKPKPEPAKDEPETKSQTIERRLILAVDDDPGVISLYRRYLERQGYQVVGVANGDEALDKAIELQPFAITLDGLMPTKDGWQVLQELKECPQTQHIPIIICSIISNKGLAFSLGAADYLIKPIMEEELLAALSRLDQGEEEAKVLVIDDQADDILLIRRILEAQRRYLLTEAHGGQIGIDLVQKEKPDLIILDLMMPEVDGFAVIEALKRDPDTRNIPIIVITAKALTEEERQRLLGQVEILLHKGLFTEHELLEDLRKALGQIELRRQG